MRALAEGDFKNGFLLLDHDGLADIHKAGEALAVLERAFPFGAAETLLSVMLTAKTSTVEPVETEKLRRCYVDSPRRSNIFNEQQWMNVATGWLAAKRGNVDCYHRVFPFLDSPQDDKIEEEIAAAATAPKAVEASVRFVLTAVPIRFR